MSTTVVRSPPGARFPHPRPAQGRGRRAGPASRRREAAGGARPSAPAAQRGRLQRPADRRRFGASRHPRTRRRRCRLTSPDCARHSQGGAELLRTESPGYVLRLGPEQRDLDRFERLVATGRGELAAGGAASGRDVTAGCARPVARTAACGPRGRAVCAGRRPAPGGELAGGGRGADRCGPGARPARWSSLPSCAP